MNDPQALQLAPGNGTPVTRPSGAHRASILLVDDQPARLLTYEAMLGGLGLHCVRALSGMEALQKLLVQEFAVIVLDVHMPEMDGFEVARLVREHPRLERTPIIFVTGVNVSELDRLKGYEVGAIDYISVPVVPEILRSKVALLVELHQRRAELKSLNEELQGARARLTAEHAAALADKEAQMAAVFEHPDQICVVLQAVRDPSGEVRDWRYVQANAQAERFIKLPREKLIGRLLSEVFTERPRSIAICNEVLARRQPKRYETRFGDVDLMVTVYPAGSELIVSTSIDITDRKRAEAEARILERRNFALVQDAPIGVCHLTMDGRFEYANRAFCELLGYTADELRTMRWQDLTHPADLPEDVRLGGEVLEGRAAHYSLEKRYIHKTGRDVWVRLFGNFVRDDAGRPVQGLAIVIDITQRRAADSALRESEARLSIAQNAAGLGIHDWNIRTGTIQWDARLHELWGSDPTQPVTYETFLQSVHPEDLAITERAIEKAVDPTGDGRYMASYRVINRKDGITRWIEATGRTFFEDGRAVRLVGTVQDVSAQKQLQQSLKLSDRRKDEFLAMLAHELRNPVAPIRNAAEVLSRLLKQEEQPRMLVGMIQRQSAHLSRILDDLLDVARITQGRIELRREVISAQACIELALESIQPAAQARGHRLTITRAPESLYIHADKVRVEQCIANLLSNAVKYTDAGGDIRVQLLSDADSVVIQVADSGVGIAPEFVPHVFELFAQSERSLDRSQGGLGIGLSICKQLVELHGGTVACASAGHGKGSTFTLRLPRHHPTIESGGDRNDVHGARSRVLIVDDNSDAADSLAMFLQLEGHDTKAVYSSEDALVQVTEFKPHVVLLDIGLPHMDGFELARRLRTDSTSLRLIALTGYGQEEDKQRTRAAGFDAHLTKPVDLGVLTETLRSPPRVN